MFDDGCKRRSVAVRDVCRGSFGLAHGTIFHFCVCADLPSRNGTARVCNGMLTNDATSGVASGVVGDGDAAATAAISTSKQESDVSDS
jgi:hypothetical protein